MSDRLTDAGRYNLPGHHMRAIWRGQLHVSTGSSTIKSGYWVRVTPRPQRLEKISLDYDSNPQVLKIYKPIP